MNREEPDSPFHLSTIATPEEVAAFEKSKTRDHCCDVSNFRIDISKGALNRWNRSAAVVFASAFVATGDYECENEKEIVAAFLSHTRTLRKKYRQRGLTQGQKLDMKKQANRDQRKISLYRRRHRTCSKYPPLRPHLAMLETFGVDGMSSDESETEDGVKRYRLLRKSWRPDPVTLWFRAMDAVAALTAKGRGNRFRLRMVSTKVDDSRAAPRGLPKNAYSSVWYANLGDFDRADLHRSEEDYWFSHTKSVWL
ncbi:hypothetical protein C8T65DRAFT_586848 [Cerioporus squamosus]|nr:hypothetical protein C8T65DRAFT_586848 [Cerioporus squamosus]